MASLIKEEGRLFGLEVLMHAVGENIRDFSWYHLVFLQRKKIYAYFVAF